MNQSLCNGRETYLPGLNESKLEPRSDMIALKPPGLGLDEAPFRTRTGGCTWFLFGTPSLKLQTSRRSSQTVHWPVSGLITQRDLRFRQESHGLIARRVF
jgi:hypothetical protein